MVEYSGIIAEHLAVRTAAGLLDVGHMGEIEIRGRRALELVNYVTSNNAAALADGQAQYSGLLYCRSCLAQPVAEGLAAVCVRHRASRVHQQPDTA